jgi:tetratricopeptide (TPR) repeat protein
MSASFSKSVPARAPRRLGRRARVEKPSTAIARAGKLVGESWVELSDASYAIENGRELFAAGDVEGALAEFERALTLPGSGTKRDRSKPAELSSGERQAALYNIASARCALGDADAALVALEGCLKAGYANPRSYGAARAMRDLDAMWDDEDLKLATRTDAFRALTRKYKVIPNAMALQFDFGNSVIGGVVEAVNEKLTPKK